jgi:hypothetical protein
MTPRPSASSSSSTACSCKWRAARLVAARGRRNACPPHRPLLGFALIGFSTSSLFAGNHWHRPTCKPRILQEHSYSYYYKSDGIKFSCATSPDGIIQECHGPMDGVAHDLRTFVDSNLGRRMDQLPDHPHGGRYVLYGDSAYRVKRTRRYISTACSIRAPRKGAQRRYSHELNRMRVTVEWMFGINYGCWELLRKRTAMMTGQSSVGMWFSVSILGL